MKPKLEKDRNSMLLYLLAPFSWLYGAIMRGRNFLYDKGIKKSYSFEPAVISVGNLSVGGTGKTPMIEYLVRLLSGQYRLAILSRGYGRRTSGFRLAKEQDDASTIGDEPFQFYQKYKGIVSIAVCEDRVVGINQLLGGNPSIRVILLDDAFQHRSVKPLFSILLTDYFQPFFKDHVLPMGRLREARIGSTRANALVVTKCKDLSKEIESEFRTELKQYSERPVFFSGIRYKEAFSVSGNEQLKTAIVLVTGIANPLPLIEYVSTHFNLIYHFNFADHYEYSVKDITEIRQKANSANASILTTEKDIVKLKPLFFGGNPDAKLWFYLPIETYFLNNGSEFDKLILEKIEHHLERPKI